MDRMEEKKARELRASKAAEAAANAEAIRDAERERIAAHLRAVLPLYISCNETCEELADRVENGSAL